MKKLFYVSMAALTLGSCTNDLSEDIALLQKEVIEISLPSVETRTIMDGNSVKWETTDHIGIFKTNQSGYANNDFTLKTGSGTTTATFEAEKSTGETSVLAYYPYNADASYDGTTLTIPLSATYTYGATTHAVMAAQLSNGTTDNIAFKNAGTLVAITIKNIPTGYTNAVMSATEKIAGNGKVTFKDGVPTLAIADNVSSTSISIDFSTNTDASKTFYFPVPVGDYANGLTIKLTGTDVEDKVVGTLKNSTTDTKFSAKRNEIHRHAITYNDQATGGIEEVVSDAKTLKEKLEEGATVSLDQSITLTEEVTVNNTSIIDLNGYDLNVGGNTITVANGASLTINNSQAATASAYSLSRATTEGATISSTTDIIKASENSIINISEGVNLTTSGAKSCCIWVPNGANGVTVNTAGNLSNTTAGAATIYVNGNVTSGTINVTGGSVKHSADVAIYIAGNADLTISNAEVEGTTGVEIRAGKLIVNEGAAIKATAASFSATANGNGSTSTGAAVAVTQHSTNYNLNATINGGTLEGVKALYEEDTCDDNVSGISMSVNGGTFNGEIYSENCSAFITKGTFSDASAFDYLADGASVTIGNNMELTKAISISNKVTIDLNGKKIENKTADSTTGLDTAKDECIVFFVNGSDAELTINDNATGAEVVATGDGSTSYYNVAVWAMNNAKVTINGGTFTNTADPANDGCDLIYGRNGATISITDGTFKAGAIRSNLGGGIYGVLNCKDANTSIAQSTITISGGKYYEFGATEASKVGNGEVVLLETGYKWSEKDNDNYYSVVKE